MRDLVFKVKKGKKSGVTGKVYLSGEEIETLVLGQLYTAVNEANEVIGQCVIECKEKELLADNVTITIDSLHKEFLGIVGLVEVIESEKPSINQVESEVHSVPVTVAYDVAPTSSVGGQIETVATLAFIATVLMGFLSGMMTGSSGIGLIVGLVCVIPGYISFILVKGYGEIVSNSAKAVDELKEIKELMKK